MRKLQHFHVIIFFIILRSFVEKNSTMFSRQVLSCLLFKHLNYTKQPKRIKIFYAIVRLISKFIFIFRRLLLYL